MKPFRKKSYPSIAEVTKTEHIGMVKEILRWFNLAGWTSENGCANQTFNLLFAQTRIIITP